MLKILVVTKNHPVKILTTCAAIHQAVGMGDQEVVVNSPQFIAEMVSKAKDVPYIKTYYPALRAYKNIEKYMEEQKMKILITVGTIDKKDTLSYNGIIGLRNDEIADYDVFDEDFNTTNIEVLTLNQVDIMFDKLEEVIHFIRIAINNYRKGEIREWVTTNYNKKQ